MILVDSSVWIELLRGSGSRAHLALRDLATSTPTAVATTEPVVMELLAGPTDPVVVRRLEDQLGTVGDLPVDPTRDFRDAAALARAVRRAGHTVRSLTDCLITSVALRHGAPVWHCDEDYVRLAAVCDLQHRDLR